MKYLLEIFFNAKNMHFYYLNIKEVLYKVRPCHWPEMSSRADSPSDI